MAIIGTKDFGHYRGMATNQGCYKYYFNAVGTMVSAWPLYIERVVWLSSGVVIKRGSIVCAKKIRPGLSWFDALMITMHQANVALGMEHIDDIPNLVACWIFGSGFMH